MPVRSLPAPTGRPLWVTLLPIAGVAFIMFLVTGVALPVLPLYVHQGLGFGTFMVGLAGAQFTAALVSRFWSGRFVDTRGARRATLAGLLLAAAAGLLFGAFVLGRVVLGHLPDRAGGARMALASVVLEAVGLALIWAAPSRAVALLGAATSGFISSANPDEHWRVTWAKEPAGKDAP